MRKIVFFGLFLLCLGIKAQEKEYVNAFKNKQLINAQTAVIPDINFTISHALALIS